MPSQEEPLRKISKIVNSFMARPDCAPFCEPVDWRGLELWDYPKIIKKMMDLGTVKRKLDRKQYATAHECATDIRLIWKNCMAYNADGSDFWLLAKAFARRFEDRYRKVRSEYDVGEDLMLHQQQEQDDEEGENKKSPRDVSLDSKSNLAQKIFLLSGSELAHVMTTLENHAPESLESINGNSAQVEINVDAIDGKTFGVLEKYVNQKVASRHGNTDFLPEESGGRREGSAKKRKK